MASRQRAVIWAESAATALEDVVAYIAKDSREGALRVLTSTLETAASLTTLAERGRTVPELADETLRELFVFRYRLMYRVFSEHVTIVAFVHGARDFANWSRDHSHEI